MEESYTEMSDKKFMDEFENHLCLGESCGICAEYMKRFNPEREIELGITEDPRVNEPFDQVNFEL